MKALLSCLLSAFCLFGTCAAEHPCLHSNWELVFEDEFTGRTLDPARWRLIDYEKGYSSEKDIPDWRRYQSQDAGLVVLNRPARGRGHGDKHLLPQAEGMVTLWGKRGSRYNNALKEAGFQRRRALTYACGGITTEKTFAFQFGYVEVRARFDSANGVWPAIWMKPVDNTNWPRNGEIDIMEHLNHEPVVYQTLHYLANDGKSKVSGKGTTSRDWSAQGGQDGWHTYGMLWARGSITFFVDGRKTGSFSAKGSANWPFDRNGNLFYLIIDQQVGGSWVQGALGGKPMADLSASPAALDIDYVRVYSTVNFRHSTMETPAE